MKKTLIIFVIFLLFYSILLADDVLDFEGTWNQPTYTEDGYQFTIVGGDIGNSDNAHSASHCLFGETAYWIEMHENIDRIDVISLFMKKLSATGKVIIRGESPIGSEIVSQEVSLTSSYQSFALTGFTNIERLYFQPSDFSDLYFVDDITCELVTLPVVLSTFTGQYINNVPTLHWSTQTETDNLGWNVYRNIENNFASATRVNTEFIPGHGTTSQIQNYIYEDVNGPFEAGENYWYWLESIDYSGTVNHYDRVALIHIPEIQNPDPHNAVPRKYGLQTGPNPFNSNLSVSYMLPQTDMVRIEIYNLYGQLVAKFNEGLRTADREYTIDWDGKDIYGQNVASGVLLIKLITSKDSETIKAILLR